MDEVILPSGAKLGVGPCPFGDAHRLVKAIMGSLKGADLPAEVAGVDTDDLGAALKSPALLSTLMDRILTVATSDDVERAVMACMERCTYDGEKITRDLFDDPEVTEKIREDYYRICMEVVKANCAPFFRKAFSGLKVPQPTKPSTQQ